MVVFKKHNIVLLTISIFLLAEGFAVYYTDTDPLYAPHGMINRVSANSVLYIEILGTLWLFIGSFFGKLIPEKYQWVDIGVRLSLIVSMIVYLGFPLGMLEWQLRDGGTDDSFNASLTSTFLHEKYGIIISPGAIIVSLVIIFIICFLFAPRISKRLNRLP